MNSISRNEKEKNDERKGTDPGQEISGIQTGRICEVEKNSYVIRFGEQELPAKLKGSFYEEDAEKLPVVGDYVKFVYNPYGDSLIQSAIESGKLSGERWRLYQNLGAENRRNYAKKKEISKWAKARKKYDLL